MKRLGRAKNQELTALHQLEYESALNMTQHFSTLRRQDMAFVIAVQAAVFTLVGKNLLHLDLASFFLSLVAAFVLLLGINSERRLSAYIVGYMKRATQIESECGMQLLHLAKVEVDRQKWLFSNRSVFLFYYYIFLISWIIIWILNILTLRMI